MVWTVGDAVCARVVDAMAEGEAVALGDMVGVGVEFDMEVELGSAVGCPLPSCDGQKPECKVKLPLVPLPSTGWPAIPMSE